MASPASTEASEIRRRGRQRLIGAIALVMLLVVFVPMFLDSEPRPSKPVAPIPPKENAPPLPAPKAATVPAPSATPTPAPTPTAAVTPTQAGAPSPAPDASLSKPVPPAGSVPKAAPPAEVKVAPKLEGFAVQVGAFRDEAKLRSARDKLAASGVVHFTERLESPGGPLTRLRAGPFPTREAAEAAQAKLKRAGLEGKVVPLP